MRTKLRSVTAVREDATIAIEAWRAVPTRDRTLAVCRALIDATPPPPARIVSAVVRHAMRTWPRDPELLVAVGRLQLQAGDLRGAHQTLALAETIAPAASAPTHWLGEVLLRLGDARRAVIAFDLARMLRDSPDDVMPCGRSVDDAHARAIELCALQLEEGELAVAEEIARTPKHPHQSGVHARLCDDRPTRAVRPPRELIEATRPKPR